MMIGGRTKIGIGRTTRVKAVSVIAWRINMRTLCTSLISNTAIRWISSFLSWNQMQKRRSRIGNKSSPIISHHDIWYSQKKNRRKEATYKIRRHSHVLQQFLRIPPRCRCCPAHQYLQTAHCVSSDPHYRCLHLLWSGRQTQTFVIHFTNILKCWLTRNAVTDQKKQILSRSNTVILKYQPAVLLVCSSFM